MKEALTSQTPRGSPDDALGTAVLAPVWSRASGIAFLRSCRNPPHPFPLPAGLPLQLVDSPVFPVIVRVPIPVHLRPVRGCSLAPGEPPSVPPNAAGPLGAPPLHAPAASSLLCAARARNSGSPRAACWGRRHHAAYHTPSRSSREPRSCSAFCPVPGNELHALFQVS